MHHGTLLRQVSIGLLLKIVFHFIIFHSTIQCTCDTRVNFSRTNFFLTRTIFFKLILASGQNNHRTKFSVALQPVNRNTDRGNLFVYNSTLLWLWVRVVQALMREMGNRFQSLDTLSRKKGRGGRNSISNFQYCTYTVHFVFGL